MQASQMQNTLPMLTQETVRLQIPRHSQAKPAPKSLPPEARATREQSMVNRLAIFFLVIIFGLIGGVGSLLWSVIG
ncbi:MAG: hypothetical protein AAF206_15190 [Bacteroidota bacterium]